MPLSLNCTEVVDLVLKNQECRITKYILVNLYLDYCLKKDGYNREIIKILAHDYISMNFCDYLEQLCPSVTITLADQKICILDEDKKEISLDSITNTLDSSKKEKFKKAYELLSLNHDKNYEALTNMLYDKETKKIFRDYSDNLFIEIMQKLLDLLRKICSRSISRNVNSPSFFKDLTEYTKHLRIENSISDSEQTSETIPILRS